MLNSRVICVHAYLSLLSTLEVVAMLCANLRFTYLLLCLWMCLFRNSLMLPIVYIFTWNTCVSDKYHQHGVCTIRDPSEGSISLWEARWRRNTRVYETLEMHLFSTANQGQHRSACKRIKVAKIWTILSV